MLRHTTNYHQNVSTVWFVHRLASNHVIIARARRQKILHHRLSVLQTEDEKSNQNGY